LTFFFARSVALIKARSNDSDKGVGFGQLLGEGNLKLLFIAEAPLLIKRLHLGRHQAGIDEVERRELFASE
jgi:hypothetical protein